LRERTRAVAGPERLQRRAGVRAAEVVPLPASAVIEDRLAAVRVPDRREPRRDFPDRGVPVDLLERAVGTPPQWRRQPVRPVLVVVDAERLVARVAARRRMRLVAADARDVPPAV